MREIRMLRSTWRGLETESRLGLHGHERGNPGYRQDLNLTDHRASPRPYQDLRADFKFELSRFGSSSGRRPAHGGHREADRHLPWFIGIAAEQEDGCVCV